MKHKILLALSTLFLLSCGKQIKEVKGLNDQLIEQYEVSETSNGSIFKSGFYKSWYSNGQIHTDCNYDENKLDGHYKDYYKGGEIRNEGEYKSGGKEGEWILNHPNGKVEDIMHYKEGLANGEFQSFYNTGEKRAEGIYANGKEEGKFTYWNEDGTLFRTKMYRAGVDVSLEGKWLIDNKNTITYNPDGTYTLETDKGTETDKYKIKNNFLYLGNDSYKFRSRTDSTYSVTRPVYFDQTPIQARRID